MIVIKNTSELYFEFNGLNYSKIYQPLVNAGRISIYNIYNGKELTDRGFEFDDFEIDGLVPDSLKNAMDRLVDVIYLRDGDVVQNISNNYITNNTFNDAVENMPDNEDLESSINLLRLRDRFFDSFRKGYKIIRDDFDFSDISDDYKSSVWEIRKGFDLGGLTVDIPENVVLFFNGGSFRNGVLNGEKTGIVAGFDRIFIDVGIQGEWRVKDVFPEWFGAVSDGVLNCTKYINEAINLAYLCGGSCVKLLVSGRYKVFPESDETISDINNPFYWGCLELKDNVRFESRKGVVIYANNEWTPNIYKSQNRNRGVFSFTGNDRRLPEPTRNVQIINVTVEGGYNGVTACNVENLRIENFKTSGNSLDGIYLGFPGVDIPNDPKDIYMKDIHVDGCRRNGISILRGKSIYLDGFLAENIIGEAPQAGFDIEPEFGALVEDVYFSNIESRNNVLGASVIAWEEGDRRVKNIHIENMNIKGATLDDFHVQIPNEVTLRNIRIDAGGSRYLGMRVYKGFNCHIENIRIFNGRLDLMLENSIVNDVMVFDSPDYGVKFDYVYNQFIHKRNTYSNFSVINSQNQSFWCKNIELCTFSNFKSFNSNLEGLSGNNNSAFYAENIKQCILSNIIVDSEDGVNLPVNGVCVPNTSSVESVLNGSVVKSAQTKYRLFWGASCVSDNNI